MFKRMVIANRGEIANRIISTCIDLGIETVAIYSDDDRSLHYLNRTDFAYRVGGGHVASSYKNQDAVIGVAKISEADSLHPGYGFLAEVPSFAKLCKENNIKFIGSDDQALANFSDKLKVRILANKLGIKTVPCFEEPVTELTKAKEIAKKLGYPVIIKPVTGNHARGLRRLDNEAALEKGFVATQIEGNVNFGHNEVLIEKALVSARHIEVPVLRDKQGNISCLPELDCSIQRRYLKIFAESPAPNFSEELRTQIKDSAKKLAEALKLEGLATFEFLLKDGVLYFLEVNPRLSVEHSVTEMVTGLDLVRAQILISAGQELEPRSRDVSCRGVAMQCRIYAENPENYEPYSGVINDVFLPMGPYVRHELIAHSGWTIPIHYDHMLAKMSVWGPDRGTLVGKMTHLLKDYFYSGIITNISLQRQIFQSPELHKGTYDVDFLRDKFVFKRVELPQNFKTALAVASAIRVFKNEEQVTGGFTLKGKNLRAWQKDLGTGRL